MLTNEIRGNRALLAQTSQQITHGPSQDTLVRRSFLTSQHPTAHSMEQLHSTHNEKVELIQF